MIPTNDRLTRVLVLIPTLEVGGAEMDLARNLPRLDPRRFKIAVCTFLARGALAQPLLDAGIELIGPILPKPGKRKFVGLRSGLKSLVSAAASAGRSVAQVLPAPMRRAGRRASVFCRRLLLRRIRLPPGLGRSWQYLFAIVPIPALRRSAAAALSYLRMGAAISAHIRDREIDIVHAVLPNSYVVGGIATLLARRRLLIMSRVSLNWYQDGDPILRIVERRVLHRTVDAVICNSVAILQDLIAEEVAISKIRLIPNGIDMYEFASAGVNRNEARDRLGISQDVLVLSMVANLHPYKGHADLLHALQLVRDRLPVSWMLLAPGRDVKGHLDRMRQLSDELGLTAHIRFLGERGDVAVILRAADIHVSASHTEGFPNNILEAMCIGLPVVATAVGGVSEMVVDGQTGLLVPPEDPEAMARALHLLAHDPERRTAMGEAGRNLVSSFSIERSTEALEHLYAELAAGRRS